RCIAYFLERRHILDELTRIQLADGAKRCRLEQARIRLGPDHQRPIEDLFLRERLEYRRRRIGVEPRITRVADDADDGAPITGDGIELEDFTSPRDAPANRILIPKQTLGERLVDDDDPGAIATVG